MPEWSPYPACACQLSSWMAKSLVLILSNIITEYMDRSVEESHWTPGRIALWSVLAVLSVAAVWYLFFRERRAVLSVQASSVMMAPVSRGTFQETVPQSGTVESRSVFLDAVEGGTIKRVARESGAMVQPGDLIMELSNLNREISVLQQESSQIESINRSRDTRLSIIRNDLEQRQTLAQIDNQLAILKPQYDRQKVLFAKKLISRQEYEKTEADYQYNLKRRKITYEAYRKDSLTRLNQLADIDLSETRMKENLEGVRKILENLSVKAPVAGQLTSQHWEVGQSVNPGQRLGRIDIPGSLKVRVPVDELYLPRIRQGQRATAELDGKNINLAISYIYPAVNAGRFEVDMDFSDSLPRGIRSGQTLRLRIEMSDPTEAILLPTGGFFSVTGGNWIFVLEPGGQRAIRRNLRLGRKNPEYYEVLEGLSPGDRVVISGYESFAGYEVIELTAEPN